MVPGLMHLMGVVWQAQSMGGESLGTSQGGHEDDAADDVDGADGADAEVGSPDEQQQQQEQQQKPVATGAGRRKRYPDTTDPDGTVRQMTAKEFRRLRRRVTNRESAKRMRAKREGELADVQQQVAAFALLGCNDGTLREPALTAASCPDPGSSRRSQRAGSVLPGD